MSAKVLDGFMTDISAAIIAALEGPRGKEIATLVVKRASEAERATVASAKKACADGAAAVTIAEMLGIVAAAMGVSPEAMRGKGRTRVVADARAVFAHLARTHTTASHAMIGRELGGQDHSTITKSAPRGGKLILTSERAREAAAAVVSRWNTSHGDGLG